MTPPGVRSGKVPVNSQNWRTFPCKLATWAQVHWEVCGEASLLHAAGPWPGYLVGKQRLGAAAVELGETQRLFHSGETQVQEGSECTGSLDCRC